MSTNEVFLKGRKAIVTGGTRGIGYAIAEALLKAGASVSICGRNPENVSQAIESLKVQANAGGGSVVGMAMDASRYEDHMKFYQFTDDKLGDVEIVVNNAGVGVFKKTSELALEDWHRVIDTNLSGVFYSVQEALKRFKRRGGGYLIQISSLAGKNPFSGGAAYNASKFGLEGFSEAVMLDHRYDNVRVTTIMPGSVATEFGSPAARVGTAGAGSAGAGSAAASAGAANPAKTADAVNPAVSAGGSGWKIAPEDIAQIVLDLLRMPERTLISRVEVRPSKPRRA